MDLGAQEQYLELSILIQKYNEYRPRVEVGRQEGAWKQFLAANLIFK